MQFLNKSHKTSYLLIAFFLFSMTLWSMVAQADGFYDPEDPDTYLYNDSAAYDAVLIQDQPMQQLNPLPPRYGEVAEDVIYNDLAAYEHAHGRPFQAIPDTMTQPMIKQASVAQSAPSAQPLDLFDALNTPVGSLGQAQAPHQVEFLDVAAIQPTQEPPVLARLGTDKSLSLAQGNYLVFGSFTDPNNAHSLADQTGLMTAMVMPVAVGAQNHYRVLAGPFFSGADIRQAKGTAQENGAMDSWILEIP